MAEYNHSHPLKQLKLSLILCNFNCFSSNTPYTFQYYLYTLSFICITHSNSQDIFSTNNLACSFLVKTSSASILLM